MNTLSLQQLLRYCPVVWVGAIALGPSIESVCFVLMLFSICVQPHALHRITEHAKQPWYIALLLIAAWTTLSSLWAPHWDLETWFSLKKIYRLLLVPLIMLVLNDPLTKQRALDCFLFTMSITALLALAKYNHWLIWRDEDPGHLFYNHIITGFMAAFAAYLSLTLCIIKRYWVYGLLWLLFSLQILVINPGKMACGLYLVLMIRMMWIYRKNAWLWPIIACGGVSLLFSPVFQQGVLSLLHDGHLFQHGERATSLGFRVQFHQFAWTLVKAHPFLGNGPGAYAYWFKQLNPVPAWLAAPNTHSQYWLIATETGLMGMLLWANALIALWRQASVCAEYGELFKALLLIIALNSLTDNVIDVSVGYLFLAFAALAFAQNKTQVD
jgi:O-antigen ligase